MNSNKLIKSIKDLFISTKTISNDVIYYKFRLLHKYLIFIFILTFITIGKSSFALDIDINDETLCKSDSDTNCVVYHGGHYFYDWYYVREGDYVNVCDKYVVEVNSINDINIKCRQTSRITRETSYFRDLVNSLNNLAEKTESTTPTITSSRECNTSFSDTKGNTENKSSSTSFSDYKSRDKIEFRINYRYEKNGVSNSCSGGSCEYWKGQQISEPKKEDYMETCWDDEDKKYPCLNEWSYRVAVSDYNYRKRKMEEYCRKEEGKFIVTEIEEKCKDADGYRCMNNGKTECTNKISYGSYKIGTGVNCTAGSGKDYVGESERYCHVLSGSAEGSFCIYDEYKCCTRIATYKARVIKDYYAYKIEVYKPSLRFNEKALIEVYDPNLIYK